jgi:hypothetical protein
MSLVLDPIASLQRQTLVFCQNARHQAELAPKVARLLPTGGYLFVEKVRQRLAMIAGVTIAELLPEGGSLPRIDVPSDRQIKVKLQHKSPQSAARECSAKLWRLGHACRIEERSLGQVELCLERLPIRIRFVPDRSALLRHLEQRFQGRRLQLSSVADLSG